MSSGDHRGVPQGNAAIIAAIIGGIAITFAGCASSATPPSLRTQAAIAPSASSTSRFTGTPSFTQSSTATTKPFATFTRAPTETSTVRRTNTVALTQTPTVTATLPPTKPPPRTPLPPLPELKVGPSGFVDANGKPMLLKGAAAWHFNTVEQDWIKWSWFHEDIRLLRNYGANFLEVPFNFEMLEDERQLKAFLAGLEYAHALGFTGIAVIASGNGEIDRADYFESYQIRSPVGLADKWRELLSKPDVRAVFARSVNIMSPLSEPSERQPNPIPNCECNKLDLTMDEWHPIASEICQSVNKAVGKELVCMVAGVQASWDLQNHAMGLNEIADVHVYKNQYGLRGVQDALNRGVPVVVGEIGFVHTPEDLAELQRQMEFIKEHNLSFAAWGMVSIPESIDQLIDRDGSLHPAAKIIFPYFK